MEFTKMDSIFRADQYADIKQNYEEFVIKAYNYLNGRINPIILCPHLNINFYRRNIMGFNTAFGIDIYLGAIAEKGIYTTMVYRQFNNLPTEINASNRDEFVKQIDTFTKYVILYTLSHELAHYNQQYQYPYYIDYMDPEFLEQLEASCDAHAYWYIVTNIDEISKALQEDFWFVRCAVSQGIIHPIEGQCAPYEQSSIKDFFYRYLFSLLKVSAEDGGADSWLYLFENNDNVMLTFICKGKESSKYCIKQNGIFKRTAITLAVNFIENAFHPNIFYYGYMVGIGDVEEPVIDDNGNKFADIYIMIKDETYHPVTFDEDITVFDNYDKRKNNN